MENLHSPSARPRLAALGAPPCILDLYLGFGLAALSRSLDLDRATDPGTRLADACSAVGACGLPSAPPSRRGRPPSHCAGSCRSCRRCTCTSQSSGAGPGELDEAARHRDDGVGKLGLHRHLRVQHRRPVCSCAAHVVMSPSVFFCAARPRCASRGTRTAASAASPSSPPWGSPSLPAPAPCRRQSMARKSNADPRSKSKMQGDAPS